MFIQLFNNMFENNGCFMMDSFKNTDPTLLLKNTPVGNTNRMYK